MSLDYRVIRADPSTAVPWRELDDILLRPLKRVDGITLRVAATCVDSGGHFAQTVYNFARERYARRVYATKGIAGGGKPIWPRKPSKNNVGRVNLFLIGVDTAKEQIYARLKITAPGPAFCHWPEERDEEYFAELTSEKIVTKYSKGFASRQWVKTRARNEALDVRVLNVAAFQGLLTMGLDLEREAAKFAAIVHAVEVGARPEVIVPQRRVRSAGVALWR